ncbi:Phage DNA Packaging Protein [Sulfitobacter geojensis]|nr:Phage DNA Packaging Protein [Sulfitobacter geojensis]
MSAKANRLELQREDTPLILTERGLRSGANWIASADAVVQEQFLDDLEKEELLALPYLFEFWAMDHQLPPEGAWRTWVVMGGRGAGKTRAGAEWVRSVVEGARPFDEGACRRVALVGETIEQVREVMIFGDSGILACSPEDRRPDWEAGRKRLVWPNGAVATVHTAHDPEGLRGPQFDAAWVDELAKWKRGQEAWDQLQFALRLGDDPRVCVTTTPRNVDVLKRLLASPSTVQTHAPTEANAANLASSFLDEVKARYKGTRLGRQELDGVLLADAEGALWTSAALEEQRIEEAPAFDRIVVGLDPAASAGMGADECGIVVVGAVTQGPVQDWRAVVLADCTIQGATPSGWAKAAIAAMEQFGADKLVAEVNQGGAMVGEVLRQIDPLVPLKSVHASRGKVARAEPVAALYEQGRVSHVRGLDTLEDQMCRMTAHGFEGGGSPDRVDALVWALHELMIEPAAKWRRPALRSL